MNSKGLVIVILLLLGIGGYFGYTKFMGGKTPGSTAESTGGVKSLKDLLTSGIAQRCTYLTVNESGSVEGVTYISGGKVRGDFTTTTSGKSMTSHMISDGKISYIWTEGEKTGFKMTVTEQAATGVKTDYSDTSTSSDVNLDQKLDYECSTWVADASVFTPPPDVVFSDFSQMYAAPSSTPGSSGSSTPSQCSYCDSLTGDSKTQCLAALNCN